MAKSSQERARFDSATRTSERVSHSPRLKGAFTLPRAVVRTNSEHGVKNPRAGLLGNHSLVVCRLCGGRRELIAGRTLNGVNLLHHRRKTLSLAARIALV